MVLLTLSRKLKYQIRTLIVVYNALNYGGVFCMHHNRVFLTTVMCEQHEQKVNEHTALGGSDVKHLRKGCVIANLWSPCKEVQYPVADWCTEARSVTFSNQLNGWHCVECWAWSLFFSSRCVKTDWRAADMASSCGSVGAQSTLESKFLKTLHQEYKPQKSSRIDTVNLFCTWIMMTLLRQNSLLWEWGVKMSVIISASWSARFKYTASFIFPLSRIFLTCLHG